MPGIFTVRGLRHHQPAQDAVRGDRQIELAQHDLGFESAQVSTIAGMTT
jgi:hypothetical protein